MTSIHTGTYINYWPRYSGQAPSKPTLKPCPCCGSTNIHVVAPDDGCYCWDCGLTMPNRKDWRARWNRRVKEWPIGEGDRD